LFVRELLAVLAGRGGGERFVRARAGGMFAANGDREFFQPCGLRMEEGALVAVPADWRGSADLFALARIGATGGTRAGLVRRAANAAEVPAGAVVDVLPV
jgi:molybdopterin biosynthesis enzyme